MPAPGLGPHSVRAVDLRLLSAAAAAWTAALLAPGHQPRTLLAAAGICAAGALIGAGLLIPAVIGRRRDPGTGNAAVGDSGDGGRAGRSPGSGPRGLLPRTRAILGVLAIAGTGAGLVLTSAGLQARDPVALALGQAARASTDGEPRADAESSVDGAATGAGQTPAPAAEMSPAGATVRLVARIEEDPREVEGRFGSRWAVSAAVLAVQRGPGGETAAGSAPVTLWFGTDPTARLAETGAAPILLAGVVSPGRGGDPQISVAAVIGPAAPDHAGSGGASSGSAERPGARPGVLERARERTEARAQDLLAPDTAALVLGMAYGDDESLSEPTAEDMKTAGLTHLTAVSGSNVAIVLLLGVHAVRWTRCPRALTLLAGIAATGAYLLLVGPDPSILRATVMGVLGGISVAAGRGGSSGSALWVSIVVLLTVDPSLGADAGFVLSVAATAGIILQGPAVCRLLCGVAWRWLAEALAISIVASLWCLPYLVHLSGFWGPWTVPANVLAAPAVPLGTVCGLLAVCCSGVGPLADPLLLGAGVCARWIEAVAHGIGQAPAARVPTGDGPGAVVVAGLLAGLAAVALQLADPARRATMKELPDSLRASLAAEEEGPPCPRAAAAPRPTRPPGAAWNRPP